MKPCHVDGQGFVFTERIKDVTELSIPNHFIGRVRRAAVHGLRKSLVDAGEQDEELAARREHLVMGDALERAALVDGMNDGPAQREKRHFLPLQLQRIVFSQADAIHLNKPAEYNL